MPPNCFLRRSGATWESLVPKCLRLKRLPRSAVKKVILQMPRPSIANLLTLLALCVECEAKDKAGFQPSAIVNFPPGAAPEAGIERAVGAHETAG